MRPSTATTLLFLSGIQAAALVPRATDLTCADLRVKSNDGGRKIAIVIDSSGSMAYSDPSDLRIAAGRALNDWLISSKDATGGKKSDLVTVIDFDDVATLVYPLGEPGSAANSSFSKIDSNGGTDIASGVEMAISQLNKAGSGTTADRSGIVVFTDGESSATDLVDQINNAASLGIRVNFGFLDTASSYQDKSVLVAIGRSGGVYSTITTEDSSNNFINYALLNGLTKNDNPSGDNSTLLAGLATAHFTEGSQTQTITYNARSHEHIDFAIQSIDAGPLTAELFFGGKSKNKTSVPYYTYGYLSYTAGSSGQIEIKVSATNAPTDSLFVVGATSNMPSQNCTVGVGSGGGGGGLGTGAKVGLGLGIPIMVGLLGLLGYFMLKHWGKLPKLPKMKFLGPDLQSGQYGAQAVSWDPQPPVNGAEKVLDPGKYGPDDTHHSVHSAVSSLSNNLPAIVPPIVPPVNNPSNNKHKLRMKKRKAEEEYHHHHLEPGHPCWALDCSQSLPYHQCEDHRCLCPDPQNPVPNHNCENVKFPCACTDQKCPLNNKRHECVDPEHPCDCSDASCPLSEEQKQKRRNDKAFGMGLKVVSTAGTHIMNGV